MRPKRSTVVVFVVVAVAWHVVFFSGGVAYFWLQEELLARHPCACQLEQTPQMARLSEAIDFLGSPFFFGEWLYYLLLVEDATVPRSSSLMSRGNWTVLLINALLWATLFTTAFVLVRRVRERRAASREV